jgi:hypothetical protein
MDVVLRFPEKPPRAVTQKELAEERVLRHQAMKLLRRWEQKRRELAARLVGGAEVESGPIAVELDIWVKW